MRLDLYLSERGFCESRSEAKRFILEGAVKVGGKVISKPSYEIFESDSVEIDKSGKLYVSRGGIKLKGALDAFSINVCGRCAIDVGASSGGFTDCLLQNGVRRVYAVDSGSGQLVASIANDARVSSIENYNARYMKLEDFSEQPDLAVMDVSFISATLIIPALSNVLAKGADFVCLIKPQFEVGRSGIGKGGIVKDDKKRAAAVQRVVEFARGFGFNCIGLIESPIAGGDGNIEYLAHFRKESTE